MLVTILVRGAEAAFLVLSSVSSHAGSVVDRQIVIESSEFQRAVGINFQPDGPLIALGNSEWLTALWDKTRGGIVHMKTRGPVDRPLNELVWIKNKSQLFQYNKVKFDGNFWIVNIYQAEDGLLAFIHVENAEGSGRDNATGKHVNGGKSRIGLAWSVDGGNEFVYLGDIIIPQGDPVSFNIQGAPYLIREGDFYVYFHDTIGLTVARASVHEALSAARKGLTSSWKKYAGQQEGFTSDGRGGQSVSLGIDGISHTDAACSEYTGKCYLVLSRMNWGGRDSWLKLFESMDGIKWVYTDMIARENLSQKVSGFQYCTIINSDGKDNGVVDRRLFLYCDKDHLETLRKGLRWEIDLTCDKKFVPC